MDCILYCPTVYIWTRSDVSITSVSALPTNSWQDSNRSKNDTPSQVCREALERRIAIFDQPFLENSANVDAEAPIGRLRGEGAAVEDKVEELGRHNAAAWLATTSYLELKSAVSQQCTVGIVRYRLPKAAFRVTKRDLRKAVGGSNGLSAVAYKTPWLDYVKAVWDQVENGQAKYEVNATERRQSAEANEQSVPRTPLDIPRLVARREPPRAVTGKSPFSDISFEQACLRSITGSAPAAGRERWRGPGTGTWPQSGARDQRRHKTQSRENGLRPSQRYGTRRGMLARFRSDPGLQACS